MIMKQSAKITLALLFAALFTAPALAQVRVNPKVGVNFSGVESKLNDITAEARVGWNAGLDLRVGEGVLFLQPGLHYYNFTAQLMKEVNSPQDVNLEEETTIQSLKAPVNIGWRLTGENGLLGIHLKGGVVPTYVLGVDEKENFAFDKDQLTNFTWGANAGVGVELLFLTLDANYEIGMTDFFANTEGANNVLTISLGMKF
jgi:hypothetical protein